MDATKTLPDNYEQTYRLDLSEDTRLAISLNVIALIVLIFLLPVFADLAEMMRGETAGAIWGESVWSWLIALVAMVVVHEAIHGIFFWVYTRERPFFGMKTFYAYAAAPDWYLPRNQFVVVGLAPLVLMTLIGIATLPIIPASWVVTWLIILAYNAGGSSGDIVVVAKLLTYPPDCLINDIGDAFTIYTRQDSV